jgi:hypothetical protein
MNDIEKKRFGLMGRNFSAQSKFFFNVNLTPFHQISHCIDFHSKGKEKSDCLPTRVCRWNFGIH